MKKIVRFTAVTVLLFSFWGIISCKKPDQPDPVITSKDTIKPKPTVLEDTLKGKWEVNYATHNGTIDNGTKGIRMIFDSKGTYLLVNTGYQGTWEFLENKTKILIDKDSPDFKTTWTIKKLTNTNFDVTFISPFTGGKVEWKMIRYKF
jgi:hypothetical protein